MDKEAKKILDLFQCEFNRSIEEDFAQTFSENANVRLFFINEDEAFTDGKNIVIDPGTRGMFADKEALRKTEDYLKLDHLISEDRWYALRVITRAYDIHESLHILYTNFPPEASSDVRATTKIRRTTLSMISNIIEDAFIEAAGCSIYDNMEFFLLFLRVATLYCNTSAEGTAARAFKEDAKVEEESDEVQKKTETLLGYIDYMCDFLLYPMLILPDPPEEFAEYVEKTRQLFLDGSVCGDPDERYTYTQKIFDIIEPLIPDTDEDMDVTPLTQKLPGAKTHSGDKTSIAQISKKGKKAEVNRRLFTDLEGNPIDHGDLGGQLITLTDEYEDDKDSALRIVLVKPTQVTWTGEQFDCHSMHNHIKLIETKPKPNLNLKKAYQNIYNKYKLKINTYNSRFTQMLKVRVPVREEKLLFGGGISSKRLGDPKKRYWYRNGEEYGVPDLAVLLLIDGSGSMGGARREGAMNASVILHEVLRQQGISHAIVEHRAVYGENEVDHNILVDFDAKDEEKYNILALDADEGTREGLSLYWAEQYINKKGNAGENLIIALSDGYPEHLDADGGEYYPPVSVKDSANAVSKIMRRGTDIIAVALDDGDGYNCYDNLTEIYPSVIECTDLARLPGQLLEIVSRHLQDEI